MSNFNVNVIITAGGHSVRYGKNKLFEPCKTSCVLIEAIKPFLSFYEIKKIIIAIEPSFSDEFIFNLKKYGTDADKRIILTGSGETRGQTVMRGIEALDKNCDIVLTHDGARPFVSQKLIKEVIEGARKCDGAVPFVDMTDSMVNIQDGISCVNRSEYKRVQTPQGFKKSIFVDAYNRAKGEFTDDLSLIKSVLDISVCPVDGELSNIKITTRNDLFNALTGCGYDIHRFQSGNGIKLNGVFIPCPYSFVAHSDGDVPVHAIMDAILSAVGQKDIGHFFPVDDPAYDGANSFDLLKQVIEVAFKKGYKLSNLSVSIIAETPKIAPHIDAMKLTLANVFDVGTDKIGITATTNEQVGEIGNKEAIAAFATVMLTSC